MKITKEEAMKAVIDGSDIQHRYMGVIDWLDTFSDNNLTLISKLKAIENRGNAFYRIKPKMKTISYRNFLYEVQGENFVSMWSSHDITSEKDTQSLQEFVKWLGDKVTI